MLRRFASPAPPTHLNDQKLIAICNSIRKCQKHVNAWHTINFIFRLWFDCFFFQFLLLFTFEIKIGFLKQWSTTNVCLKHGDTKILTQIHNIIVHGPLRFYIYEEQAICIELCSCLLASSGTLFLDRLMNIHVVVRLNNVCKGEVKRWEWRLFPHCPCKRSESMEENTQRIYDCLFCYLFIKSVVLFFFVLLRRCILLLISLLLLPPFLPLLLRSVWFICILVLLLVHCVVPWTLWFSNRSTTPV